jgi:hypothetical protein
MVAARAIAPGGIPLIADLSCNFRCHCVHFNKWSGWHNSSMNASPMFFDDRKNMIFSASPSAPTRKIWLGNYIRHPFSVHFERFMYQTEILLTRSIVGYKNKSSVINFSRLDLSAVEMLYACSTVYSILGNEFPRRLETLLKTYNLCQNMLEMK